jgi:Mor family transcriptional regulator
MPEGFSLLKLKYVNAKDVLPPELLAQVQKHVGGAIVYVPKKEEKRADWGQFSGIKDELKARNLSIMNCYNRGVPVDELMDEFCLSEASIRKIIYSK